MESISGPEERVLQICGRSAIVSGLSIVNVTRKSLYVDYVQVMLYSHMSCPSYV